MSDTKRILFIVLVALNSFVISACSKSSIIENITTSVSVDTNQDVIAKVNSNINLGALSFPNLTLPIVDPKNLTHMIGSIQLSKNIQGQNQLSLLVNISEFRNFELNQDFNLPNGNQIPVNGLNGINSVPVGNHSKLYIGGNDSEIMLGLALVIPLFDSIGKYLPGMNFFLPLPPASKIDGLAGVFTGANGQNGIGLFTVIANQIQPQVRLSRLQIASQKIADQNIWFTPSNQNSNKNKSLQNRLFNLSLKREILSVK